ncbi:TIGR03752 family integrating conjugative element protein [Aggregatibacter actinomycetemcomitans]|uniref:TIGR03752 family integrating conjugative element protein n=1 Tax=Aggregatibacter actinomycetemcomitans TaxID=714 RepID=UPI0011D9E851|nr:TIGR03752 family integrating conjugative element protein [Aggregatibacter actinomycetemcomitans]TYA20944.1 TIGR03752 family integrating conjugative element protein [Aggregatibacter actinomycetemcomitans]
MQANKGFYVVIAVVAIACGLMLWFLFSAPAPQPSTKDILNIALKDLSPEQLRAMGIEGDTANDTVRTLIGKSKANEKLLQEIVSKNEKLIVENSRLQKKQDDVDYQIQQSVQAEAAALLDQFNALKDELLQFKAESKPETTNNSVNGIGYNGESLPINGATGETTNTDNSIRWLQPSDRIAMDSNGNLLPLDNQTGATKFGFPSKFKATENKNALKATPFTAENVEKKNKIVPFFTIAANSTLTNSIALTALVGRVPIDNNVTEPYPFKLLIGRDNLIANGIELPDIEGAIVSGTATGDWTLSCVRGDVKSLTFVFTDGRIVTTAGEENIGWLSDPHGVPCIQGSRKTNAAEYLSTNFLLAGAPAAAQGVAQSQTTTVVDGSAVIGAVTGNNGKYILGQALGSGLKDTAEWFRQRYGQTFDAVYVPPGQEVAVHINKTIEIDYDKLGRKVKYGQFSRTSTLD